MKRLTKKWLIGLLAIVSTLCLAFGLAACDKSSGDGDGDGNGGGGITLTAPQIALNGNVISWQPVENATRYYVYDSEDAEDNDGEILTKATTSYTILKTAPGTYYFSVAAYNADADPQFARSTSIPYEIKSSTDPGTGGGDETGGETEPGTKPTQLTAPQAAIQGNAINWEEVSGAVAYKIYNEDDELVATVTSLDVLGGIYTVLPTTYTLTDVEDGDKFTVVAVSGDNAVADSEPSEEVEYTAAATTLSSSDKVYILDSTSYVEVASGDTGELKKVVIEKNNNTRTLGDFSDAAIGEIIVRGTPAEDSIGAQYIATAEYDYDLGVYTANLVITTGDAKLYFDITAGIQGLDLGFTVSLAEPYDFKNEGNLNVTDTYEMNATDSVEAVLPYTGYWIKLTFDNTVKDKGNALYVVVDGAVAAASGVRMIINGGDDEGLIETVVNNTIYYVTASSFGKGDTVYLSSGSLEYNVTISIAVPDVVLDNAPELYADEPTVFSTIIGSQNSPSVFKIAQAGSYVLIIKSNVPGANFYVQTDTSRKLTAVVNVYSATITVGDNTFIYVYDNSGGDSDNAEGVAVDMVAIYSTGSKSYELGEGATGHVLEALLGGTSSTKTVFTFDNIEDGDYTLDIAASGPDLTFYVGLGSQNVTLTEYANNYPYYNYTKDVTIDGQTSLTIYVQQGIYIANVTLTKVVAESNLELSVGGEGTTFTLSGNGSKDVTKTFDLKNVDNGNYRLALDFTDANASYKNMMFKVGNGTEESICNEQDGYLGAQDITINGETTITFFIPNYNGTMTLTVYLLNEGELAPGETPANEGLTLKDFVLKNAGQYYDIDISKLDPGTYTLGIDNAGNDTTYQTSSSANSREYRTPEYTVYIDDDSANAITFDGEPAATTTIEIPEGAQKLKITCNNLGNGLGTYTDSSGKPKEYSDVQTVTVTLTKKQSGGGGEEEGTGGDETELTFNFTGDNQIKTNVTALDVSSLQYGWYKITFTGAIKNWANEYETYLLSPTEDCDSGVYFTEANEFTVYYKVNRATLYLYTAATWENYTIKFEKFTGGEDTSLELTFDDENNVVGMNIYGATCMDISNLKFGTYTITIPDPFVAFGDKATYYIVFNETGDNEIELSEANNWTVTVTVDAPIFYLLSYQAAYEAVHVNFEKVNTRSDGLDVGTLFEKDITDPNWSSVYAIEIDLIGVPAGSYEISISFDGSQPTWMSVEVENVSGEFDNFNDGVATITIASNSTKLTINAGSLYMQTDEEEPIPTTIKVTLRAV